LIRKKKTTKLGQRVLHEEQRLIAFSLYFCQTAEEIDIAYRMYLDSCDTLRTFYFSNSFLKKNRRLKLIKAKYYCKLTAEEGHFSSFKRSIILIGDRGYGIGSSFKIIKNLVGLGRASYMVVILYT
jgi:hypothetical protein